MKRICWLLCLLALPLGASAQGEVLFANTPGTLFTTNHLGNSGPMSGTNAFRIGLYISPDGTTTESLFTLIAVATNRPGVPGRFIYPGGTVVVPSNGQFIQYQVKAWSLFAGFSYEEAALSGFGITGKSPIGRVFPAIGGAPSPALFSFDAGIPDFPGQLTSGIVIGVPEPGTLALVALGGAMLGAALRRRS